MDIRYALRQLRTRPSFAAVIIITLAVGIGANTAIFSFVNSVLLRPLPYPHADRLAVIWSGLGYANRAPASSFELFQIRQRTREFDQVGGIWVTTGALPGEREAEQVKVGLVTSNFLPLLCKKPAFGRFFNSEDDAPNAPRTIVISHAVWTRRFSSDPAVIGRSVRFGRSWAVVIGVLPDNFRLIFPNDASVPLSVDVFNSLPIDGSDPGGPAFLHLIGRLRPGSNLSRAQADADAIAAQVNSLDTRSTLARFRLYVFSLQADDVREVRRTLLLLFGGVAFVLLIGCANVANLLMERSRQRRREITIRAALGASHGRLIRQLVTESLLLGCAGAVGALAAGCAAIRAILATRPPSFANIGDVKLDWAVFAFTFAVGILTSLLFGLAPAMSVRKFDLARGLKEAGRPSGWRRRYGMNLLVSAEVALAFVLLVGAGLLMQTFLNVLHLDPGFRAGNVSTFRVTVPSYALLHQVQQKIAALPGVQSAAAVSHLPLDDTGNWYDYYWKEGAPTESQNTSMADLRSILPGYFHTIGADLIAGRDFTDSDDAAHQHVAVIDDVLARQLWPDADALGKKLNVSDSPSGPYQFERDWLVVVGVVRHVQYHSLTAIVRPQIYLPYQLAPRPNMAIVIHTGKGASNIAAASRKQVSMVSKDMAVSQVEPLSQLVARALSESQFVSLLSILLSALALLLAAIGIYGVLSYSVARRTTEIGIRMAIGAHRAHVIKMVSAGALVSVFVGLAGGLLLSMLLMPMLQRLLFGVKPGNGANYAVILAVVLLVSALAASFPVRRATGIDPVIALRYE